jgi:hypothetical protein
VFLPPEDASYPRTLPGVPGEIKHKGYIVMAPSQAASKGNGGGIGVYQVLDDREPVPAPEWLKPKGSNDNAPTTDRTTNPHAEALQQFSQRTSAATEAQKGELLRLLRDRQNTIAAYDDWLNVVFGVHFAFAGEPDEADGRAVLLDWSLRWSAPGRDDRHTDEKLAAELEKAWSSSSKSVDGEGGPITHRTALPILRGLPQRPLTVSSLRLSPHKFRSLNEHDVMPWIYNQHYLRAGLSVTVAPGGTGKSLLAINDALSMAMGRSLMGLRCYGPKRVWYMNGGEDSDAVVRARVDAAMDEAGICDADLGDRLFILGAPALAGMLDLDNASAIKIAQEVPHAGAQVNEALVKAVINIIHENQIDVLILDPLKHFHLVNENDNGQVNELAMALVEIAIQGNCAVEVVHHTTKEARKSNGVGGIAYARGASALIDKARTARILTPMSKDQAEKFGIDDATGHVMVRDEKANYAAGGGALYFKIASKEMGNGTLDYPDGDTHGVLQLYTPPREADSGFDAMVLARQAPDVLKGLAGRSLAWSDQSPDWIGYKLAEGVGFDVGEGLTAEERSPQHQRQRTTIKTYLNKQRQTGVLTVTEVRRRNGSPRKAVTIDASKIKPPPEAGKEGALE